MKTHIEKYTLIHEASIIIAIPAQAAKKSIRNMTTQSKEQNIPRNRFQHRGIKNDDNNYRKHIKASSSTVCLPIIVLLKKMLCTPVSEKVFAAVQLFSRSVDINMC